MNTIKHITVICLLLSFSSCNDWFDIKPDSQISSNDLYATSKGYHMQINGLYQNLASSQLYAKELAWGFLDVLGQYYTPNNLSNDNYKYINDLNYESDNFKNTVNSIWSSMYHVIADANNIIEFAAKESGEGFRYGESERLRIIGEARAIRAFVHLDLLRMFAPAPKADDGQKYIPYVTDSESTINMPLTVPEILGKIETDLLQAHAEIIQFDTLNTVASESVNNGDEMTYREFFLITWFTDFSAEGVAEFWQYPVFRLNSINVYALLARAYSYAGKLQEAAEIAGEIIDNNNWNWTFEDSWELEDNRKKLSKNTLFSLYNEKNADFYEPYQTVDNALYYRNISGIFSNYEDYRYKYITQPLNSQRVSGKNKKGNADIFFIPILRLTELYYIQGEYLASIHRFNEAADILSYLKESRGDYMSDFSSITVGSDNEIRYENYLKAMLEDARLEYMGEGQSWYMYKRVNRPLYDGAKYTDFGKKYVLPIPDSENVIL